MSIPKLTESEKRRIHLLMDYYHPDALIMIAAVRNALAQIDYQAWLSREQQEQKHKAEWARIRKDLEMRKAQGDPFGELMLIPLDKNTDWDRIGMLCKQVFGEGEADDDLAGS